MQTRAQPEERVYPYAHSTLFYRVTNRRYISRILYEANDGQRYVTIITNHPRQWAYLARPHALRHPCGSRADCLKTLHDLDEFLQTGWNIGLKLNGSTITEIVYLDPDV